MKFLVFLFFGFLSSEILAQAPSWKQSSQIPVKVNQSFLANPWAGGFNSVQVESMDLNADGLEDWVIFDRSTQKLSTFLRVKNASGQISQVYSPLYESHFPKIENWFHLVDYNQDGKKDLFCSAPAGMKIYQNTSGANISFQILADPVYSEGFSGKINLYIAASDIPAIGDVDGDGDMDVLAFEPAGHYVEFHENVATKGSGLIQFKKTVDCWGDFIHNDCEDVVLGKSCSTSYIPFQVKSPNQVMHSGNSLAILPNKNGLPDFLFGHVSCQNLIHLINTGTASKPQFSQLNYHFPTGNPVQVGAFASAFPQDVNADGQFDLLVSSNTYDNALFSQNFQQSLAYYQLEGGNWVEKNSAFLQDQMLDVGENAAPLWWDADEDGDLDLLIGNSGIRGARGVRASLTYYENVGTAQQASLLLKSTDFGNFSAVIQATEIIPQAVDWDGNGKKELLISYQTFVGAKLALYTIDNKWQEIPVSVLQVGETPLFVDWNQDGKLDLLVLEKLGRIRSYQFQTDKSFQLDNTNWANLLQDLNFIPKSLSFLDVNGDGKMECLVFDRIGKAQLINFSLDGKNATRSPAFTWTADFGERVWPSAGDWNGDGKMDLSLGLGAGGVQLLENISTDPVVEQVNQDRLQVWPNPGKGPIFVMSEAAGVLTFLDLQGRVMMNSIAIQAKETKTIQLPKGFQGTVFVRWQNLAGQTIVKRLLID
ncbi:FG-GAP repeat domain-containing protein [Aquirufa ecclesiirivi]|uniref:FG-GAP repeat domain-containing protein n=1 Tax=Aquirufa ecclesiirivi TaxID=2715124 RepID=UPI003BB0EB9D